MQSHFEKSVAVRHGLSHRCSNLIGVASAQLCILKASLTISGLLASFFFVSQETGNLAYVYTHGTNRNYFALCEIHCHWVVSLGVLRAPNGYTTAEVSRPCDGGPRFDQDEV
jgi:hypothetical protein